MSFISMRLIDHHKKPELMREFLELAASNKGMCQEVWFSSEYGFPKLETHAAYAAMMADAAKKVRELGLKASLQISNTLGHGDYLQCLDFSGIAWRKMTGHDGVVSDYSNCPRDPAFLEYLAESTRLYAVWQPDAVWVDDDLKMIYHKPVDYCCFCDNCIEEFSRQNGVSFNREELVKALNDPDDWSWRKKWTEFGTQSLAGVMEVIVKSVMSVSPQSQIGLQHAAPDRAIYSGGRFLNKIAEVVYETSGKKMLSRPGGGYYSDAAPDGIVEKALLINLCNSTLEHFVDDFRPEIESFPHTAMNKTARGIASEAMLDLAYGCNALSFALMMVENERPAYFNSMFKYLSACIPFWKRYTEKNKGTFPGGVSVYYNAKHFERKLREGENNFGWAKPVLGNIYSMPTTGLPLTFRKENHTATLLHSDIIDGMSDDELKRVFTVGVITDGNVISKLEMRGLGNLTGVYAEKIERIDSVERLTDDALNGEYAGRLWIQYLPHGLKGGIYKIHSLNSENRIIGEYVRNDETVSGIASLITVTPCGGRLAVFGYSPWKAMVNSARRYQLLSAADYVSEGKLPVLIETTARMAAVPRVDSEGKLRSVVLLNASIDYSPAVIVKLRNIVRKEAVWSTPGKEEKLQVTGNTESAAVVIEPMEPWGTGVIELY